MLATQLNGFLRVFANIRNTPFPYSQCFLRVFANFEILPNEIPEERISLYIKKIIIIGGVNPNRV